MPSDINKLIFDHYWQLLANPILVNPTEKKSVELKTLHSPLNWKDVFGNDRLVEIEVGSGKGRFLKESAQRNPEVNYVGIERASKYFAKSCERLAKHDITTARLVYCDAPYFLYRHVANQSVSAFHIYFPDPWPKKRHRKRRIFNNSIWISELVRTLNNKSGKIYIATDYKTYFWEIQELFDCHPDFEYCPKKSTETNYIQTSFEIKYREQGHPIYRAVYAKS
tara:strand:- start:1082 stop:1750 length:669 start_codon:yes stop_codon:yes gene_type:complete